MAFQFKWPRFSDEFHEKAIELLNNALNKGNKPPVIADRIEVVELEMGTQPPELEIRDIGDLTLNQFRGIFKLTYAGDAHIVLRTKVQANPLYHKKPDIHLMSGSRGMLAANQPLVVPMLLRLSNFKLNSYVVLVVSKSKGITLVFKTDPLQNVDINSTFDSFTVIQKFIQKEIEGQLRQMFREDLPGIIHRLSQQWIKKSTTVEAPYLRQQQQQQQQPMLPRQGMRGFDTMSNPEVPQSHLMSYPGMYQMSSPLSLRAPLLAQRRLPTSRSVYSRPSLSSIRTTAPVPELLYDQETGTFVTETPETPAFSHLGRIHRESRGLADLAEESSEVGDTDGEGSFDVVDWDDTMTDVLPPRSEMSVTEFESIPAVGGGVISRPRVYHASSLLHSPSSSSTLGTRAPTSPALTSPALQRLQRLFADGRPLSPLNPNSHRSSVSVSHAEEFDRMSLLGDARAPGLLRSQSHEPRLRSSLDDELEEYPFGVPADVPPLTRQQTGTAKSSSASTPSTSAVQLDNRSETAFAQRSPHRRSSISSRHGPFSSPYSDAGDTDDEDKIVLRPGLNNAVSQLSLLNRSNHTLSPFARPLNHFTIRSVPPKPLLARRNSPDTLTERQPVKARRKRIFRLGSSKKKQTSDPSPLSQSSTPPDMHSERPQSPSSCASDAQDFDAAEINRYFHTQEYSPHVHISSLQPLEPRLTSTTPQSSVRRRIVSAPQRTQTQDIFV